MRSLVLVSGLVFFIFFMLNYGERSTKVFIRSEKGPQIVRSK